ncbi:MAG: hypothetical protein HYY93_01030 [Planctomycetes bacterium]|nr:hypothetical protein [Planctomycetota bacterium]
MRVSAVVLSVALFIAGCGEEVKSPVVPPSSGGAAASPVDRLAALFRAAPLEGARSVDDAKMNAKDGEALVVEGSICDFVDGLAAVNVMDLSLPP